MILTKVAQLLLLSLYSPSNMISALQHSMAPSQLFLLLSVNKFPFKFGIHGSRGCGIDWSQGLHMAAESSNAAVGAIRKLAPGSHRAEMEVKKSRFIGYAKSVNNWEEAKEYIEQVKDEHPKARHWCFGFQCGINPVHERSSDDGEPSGTAGQPILGAIQGEGLSDVVCIVVRYFGGVKLGAGGLIRSYGGAARLVLREAPSTTIKPKSSFQLSVDASYVGAIYEALSKAKAVRNGEEYLADGSFIVSVTCEQAVAEELRENIKDATKGTVEFSGDPPSPLSDDK